MFRKLTDKVIIDGLRMQDDSVLNWLYDNYFQTVKSHVTRNSGSEDDASDVFQETIIILYEKISTDSFTLTSELKGFFFGIARNIWSAKLRQLRRTEEIRTDFPDEEHDDYTDSLFQRIMTRAYNQLKPDCQKVLNLYYDGKSYEEIAEAMKMKNESYARRKKYLCKEALLEFIKKDSEYIEYQRFLK